MAWQNENRGFTWSRELLINTDFPPARYTFYSLGGALIIYLEWFEVHTFLLFRTEHSEVVVSDSLDLCPLLLLLQSFG